jgi:hypothetical protein
VGDYPAARTSSRRVALWLRLALAVGILAGCQDGPPAAPQEPTGPLLAYRSSSEIGLVDGTSVVATAAGAFTESNDAIATEDGRFVFARTADDKLATLEVQTKRAGTLPLPQGSGLGTGGGSTVVWFEQPNKLMQLDLTNPGAGSVVRQTVDLPTVSGQTGDPMLLAARGGTAIIARVESTPSPFGGPDTLYAVRGTGAPTRLGQADANTPVSVAKLSPDGASLAYALYRRSSNTCGTAAVTVVNADGSQQTFDVAAPDPDVGSQIMHVWWPKTGPLNLSLGTWQCAQPETFRPLVWQLTGDRLDQTTPRTAALQTAQAAPGQQALIVPQGTSPEPSGTLVFEDSGRRVTIKPDVDAIAVVGGPA